MFRSWSLILIIYFFRIMFVFCLFITIFEEDENNEQKGKEKNMFQSSGKNEINRGY